MRRLTLLLGFALVAAGCVWPVPLPGQPVPTIETSVSWDASAATLTAKELGAGRPCPQAYRASSLPT